MKTNEAKFFWLEITLVGFLYLIIPTFCKKKKITSGNRAKFLLYSGVFFSKERLTLDFLAGQIAKKAEDFIATSCDIYGC